MRCVVVLALPHLTPQPNIPDSSVVVARDDRVKKRQKDNFDAHREARNLPVLEPGDTVWVTDH